MIKFLSTATLSHSLRSFQSRSLTAFREKSYLCPAILDVSSLLKFRMPNARCFLCVVRYGILSSPKNWFFNEENISDIDYFAEDKDEYASLILLPIFLTRHYICLILFPRFLFDAFVGRHYNTAFQCHFTPSPSPAAVTNLLWYIWLFRQASTVPMIISLNMSFVCRVNTDWDLPSY